MGPALGVAGRKSGCVFQGLEKHALSSEQWDGPAPPAWPGKCPESRHQQGSAVLWGRGLGQVQFALWSAAPGG